MRKLIIILLFLPSLLQARNYYFSNSGNDANMGTIGSPMASITKVNMLMLAGGDSIFLKTGDTFYGTITITKTGAVNNPVFYGAYGSGAKPVITGFTTVSGWTNEGGGIYSKVITAAAQTNMVTINGAQYGMGRYPDNTYLTYQSTTGNRSITSSASFPDYTGAEVVIRKNDFLIARCKDSAQVGQTIYYTGGLAPSFTPTPGYGFFFQNDLRTLTTYGEWYHNTGTGKFYMFFGGAGPTTEIVKVATLNNLVLNNGNFDNITIRGINFTGSISNAINFNYAQDNIQILKNDISFAGGAGMVFLDNCTNTLIDGNTVSYCNRCGIDCNASVNSVITNNIVNNIGMIPGQDIATTHSYEAIYVRGDNAMVSHNTVRNTAQHGITMKYNGSAIIESNRIDSTCLVLDDGGGIYTAGPDGSTRIIRNNIITNGIGNDQGTTRTTPLAVGIYLDEVSTNVQVYGNTVSNHSFAGIKLHKANMNTITNNTVFDNLYGIDFEDYIGNNIRLNTIKNNTFLARGSTQYAVKWYTVTNDISQFGNADSNYYTRPINDNQVFNLRQPSTGYLYYTLSQWQTFTGKDAHSKKSPWTVSNVNQVQIYSNASDTLQIVSFPGLKKISLDGTVYSNQATVARFVSLILRDSGSVVNQKPVASISPVADITLPTNQVTLTSTSTDADGTIQNYNWSLFSGGAYSITSPTLISTNVNSLVAGIYQFRLIITDNLGASDTTFISFTVNPMVAPPNLPPTVSAGADQVITSPTSSVSVTATAIDPDGTIASYFWTQISGPATYTIASPTSATTTISGLVVGIYNFQCKVKDNSGDSAISTMKVTVNAAPINIPPIADAGADTSLAYPVNSITLNGKGTDQDGTITGYLWQEGATTLGTTSTINLTGITVGVHTYTLTVTDNIGATGSDTVQITVNGTPTAPIGPIILYNMIVE